MLILAVETVTRAGSLALFDGRACQAVAGDPTETHGTRLPREVMDFLVRQGAKLADVDLFAVVSGPGSFTGLRVGMAAVQGLVLPTKRRVVPVPTLEAIASSWWQTSQTRDLVVPCLDGQRGDVFYAMYDAAGAATFDECRCTIDASVGTPETAAARIELARSGRHLVVVGGGTFDHAATWQERLTGAEFTAVRSTLAEAAARLAFARTERAVSPHGLRPLYVRRPDAELARARARSGGETASSRQDGPDLSVVRIERVFDASDVAVVELLQRQSFTNAWGTEALTWEVEHSDVARLYLMRSADGAPLAYCACWFVVDELHINSLAVEPRFRRRGLAKRLLAHVIAEAVAAGVRSATLEVRESNQAARALYEGSGFRVEGVRRDYYQSPREDALVLWRREMA